MTTPRKPKRTATESAQFHRDEAERHARKAWLAEHPEVQRALDLAEQCAKLSAKLPKDGPGKALHSAAHDIDEKCEHVIQAGLAAPAPAAQGKENE